MIKTLRMIPFLNKVANYDYGLDINGQDPDSVKQSKTDWQATLARALLIKLWKSTKWSMVTPY